MSVRIGCIDLEAKPRKGVFDFIMWNYAYAMEHNMAMPRSTLTLKEAELLHQHLGTEIEAFKRRKKEGDEAPRVRVRRPVEGEPRTRKREKPDNGARTRTRALKPAKTRKRTRG